MNAWPVKLRTFAGVTITVAFGLSLLAVGHIVEAALLKRPEYEVKAAFLHRVATFVEWPDVAFSNKTNPFVIGVLGVNPFGSALERTLGKANVQGRPISVVLLPNLAALSNSNCQLVFISASEKSRLSEIRATLRSRPILTVGDTAGFEDAGVIVNLLVGDEDLRLHIDLGAANTAGLKIDSQLLGVAASVKRPDKRKGSR